MNVTLQHEHIIFAWKGQSRLILVAVLLTVIVHAAGLVALESLRQTQLLAPLSPPPMEISLITPPPQVAPRESPPVPKPIPAISTPVTHAREPIPTEPTEEPVPSMPIPQPIMSEPEPIKQVQVPVAVPPPPLETNTEPVDTSPAPVAPPSFNAAYLNNPSPVYPSRARKLGLQGTVMLRVEVNPTGRAEQISILTSSGVPVLDETAINTVRQWTFVPARQGDHPVAGTVNVPIRFVLN